MKIQQHDGVVVDVAAISAGLHQASARGRCVAEGEGGTKSMGAAALPPIYIGPRGGGAPALGDGISKGGRRPGGWSAPQGKWGAPST